MSAELGEIVRPLVSSVGLETFRLLGEAAPEVAGQLVALGLRAGSGAGAVDLVVAWGAFARPAELAQAGRATRVMVLLAERTAPVPPEDDPAASALQALASEGLFRVFTATETAIVVARGDAATAVERYERRLAALAREAAAYQLVAGEYQRELLRSEAAFDELDRERALLIPGVRAGERTRYSPLVDDLVALRARFAPAGSLRTRAFDLTVRGVRAAAQVAFRGFDARDRLLHTFRRRLP